MDFNVLEIIVRWLDNDFLGAFVVHRPEDFYAS